MRVIIDTNCLIASIPPKNPEYWLYIAFRRKDFDWCVSSEIMLEYEEILSNFYSPLTADLVLNILLTASNVVRSANVNYLVTNDHDFDVLKDVPFPSIKVVSLSEFQKIMGY
jgi:uncharacterized protein